eukprot:2757415-Amphidinium_carterae.2
MASEAIEEQQMHDGMYIMIKRYQHKAHDIWQSWRASMATGRWHMYEYIGSGELVQDLDEVLQRSVVPLQELTPRRALRLLCEKVLQTVEGIGRPAGTFPAETSEEQAPQPPLPEQTPPVVEIEFDFDEVVNRELDPLLAQDEEELQAEEELQEDLAGPELQERLRAIPVHLKRAVRRAHAAQGHPTKQVLKIMLTLAGANIV